MFFLFIENEPDSLVGNWAFLYSEGGLNGFSFSNSKVTVV